MNSVLLSPLHALNQNGSLTKHLHVSDLHKVYCPCSKLCGEFPNGRGFSVELKYLALLDFSGFLKPHVPHKEISKELRTKIPEFTV